MRKHADYQRVYRAGRRSSVGLLTYFVAPRVDADATAGPRVGFTTPRALGKAVDRNRIRRRTREAVRLHIAELTAAVDLVLHPRRTVLTAEFAAIEREIVRVFKQVQGGAGTRAEPAKQIRAEPANRMRAEPARPAKGYE